MQRQLCSLTRVLKASGAKTRRKTLDLARNDRGSAAVEFALVALPFFMFVLSVIGVGLYFFTSHALEHGVEAAARKIRTGEAQKGSLTVGQFKQLLCNEAGSYINCNKLHVIVHHSDTWSGISPQPCVDNNHQMTPSTGSAADGLAQYSGEASEVALVTACYEWDLAKMFSFMKLGAGPDGSGSAVLQAATAFRIEPYSTS
jgi:hypothetical protein